MPHPNLEPDIPSAIEPWRQNLRGEHDLLLRGPRPAWWWTGLAPENCPGLQPDGRLTALPQPDLATCTRESVLAAFDNGWTLTEVLFAGLQGEEAFYRPPYHHLRHPMVFYYGHPAALYVNKLRVAGLIDNPINPYFERIFETGVDEMRWDDMSKNEMRWPSFSEVHTYRQQVYLTVRRVIETHPGLVRGHATITMDDPLWALFMGFEHERIHIETSSVLIRELPLGDVRRPEEWPALHASTGTPAHFPPIPGTDFPAPHLVDIPATTVRIGKPRDWPSFGWDNEYGERRVALRAFQVENLLVSNGAFLEFIQHGGYLERQWWSDAGWEWRGFRNSKWPCFWMADGPAGLHRYTLRTLFETIEMPWNWPAEVNAHEAAAYCAWRSARDGIPCRLPTEAEHHALRDASWADTDPPARHDGATLASVFGWNSQLAHGSPRPVDAGTPSPAGVHDVFGNVWQWHGDDFHPLPGARVHPYYDDFSTPCYDGQHQMILGGSWISCGDEASVWARFHFRPHFFQHAGFRVVQAAHDGNVMKLGDAGGSQVYEDARMVDDYMLLHHGEPQTQMPWAGGPQRATSFPQRCADWLLDAARLYGTGSARALDIGCAVGGGSFELARGFAEVLGVDLSRAFIDAAATLQQDGSRPYFRRDEGDLGETVTARIDPGIDRSRVSFRQADACALPAELADFDAVLLANLLCRLPSPLALLGRLGGPRGLVKVGGLVALFSPYSWLEQFTPREAWLGGYAKDGQAVRSADTLKAFLAAEGFALCREEDVPLVIREHARKYQFIVTHGMLWQRER